MPKPASIVNFERFFWASMIVGFIGTYFAWPNMQTTLEQSGSPYSMTWVVIGIAIISTITIGLWYGIAKRRNNIMRWIYVGLMGFSSLSTLLSLTDPQILINTAMIISLASTALIVASIACLFRRDAVMWLKGKSMSNPEIFQ